MPILLAIETSSDIASAALLQGDQVMLRDMSGVQTHSHTILPMVQALLTQAGITLRQCDALAFGSGPGSFTGVRTACGIAQGLAFGAGLPLVPVVTLEAMAQACMERTGATDVLAVLDARMNEVYWAQYRHQAGRWQAIIAPTLSDPAMVLAEGPVVACGNGLAAYCAAFAGQPYMATALPDLMPHAAQTGRLGGAAFLRGESVHARDAQPLYLRNKIALTTAERSLKMAGEPA